VGILSKFPIEETADLNSMIKAVVTVDGKHATVPPLKTVSLNQKYFFS